MLDITGVIAENEFVAYNEPSVYNAVYHSGPI
jgi:hypothetical protein